MREITINFGASSVTKQVPAGATLADVLNAGLLSTLGAPEIDRLTPMDNGSAVALTNAVYGGMEIDLESQACNKNA